MAIKCFTNKEIIEKVVNKIRLMVDAEFGPALTLADEECVEKPLREITRVLGMLSQESLLLLYGEFTLSYSMDCPCGQYRTDIDGYTGEMKLIELAATPAAVASENGNESA